MFSTSNSLSSLPNSVKAQTDTTKCLSGWGTMTELRDEGHVECPLCGTSLPLSAVVTAGSSLVCTNCEFQLTGCSAVKAARQVLARMGLRLNSDENRAALFCQCMACVLYVVRSFPFVESLQEQCWTLLFHLTEGSGIKHTVDRTSFSTLLAGMKALSCNSIIQQTACLVLSHLSLDNPENKQEIALCGGIECILLAMTLNHTNVPIVKSAFLTLLCLVNGNLDNCRDIFLDSGISLVLQAMRMHIQNPNIQGMSCELLLNLAFDWDLKNKIGVKGGINSLIVALQTYPTNAAVQVSACGALWNVSVNHSENQVQIAQTGSRHIIGTMKNHLENSVLQENACGILNNLALSPVIARSLAKEGGVSCILETMKYHASVGILQAAACATLINFSNSIGNDLQIGKDGVLAIVSAIRAHSNTLVQQNGCAILHSLSRNIEYRTFIFREGGVECVLKAMKALPHTPLVQQHSCGVLMELASHRDFQIPLASQGAITCVLEAMSNTPLHAKIQQNACGFLWNITTDNTKNKKRVVEEGGIPCILQAMRCNPEAMKVQYNACGALLNLAYSTDTIHAMLEMGAKLCVHNAMTKHPQVLYLAPSLVSLFKWNQNLLLKCYIYALCCLLFILCICWRHHT
ncbi:Vacuolar protein 8 [Pelomyxa schiedti]|nr:Vacuolar protein 8 [Pelomyxa schiedti]